MSLNNIKIIDIPEFTDHRGGLSFVENRILPFKMKRIFYIYNVPKGCFRGRHAHIEHFTFLVAINGSFKVSLINTKGEEKIIILDKPNMGLLIPNMIWHELTSFSKGAVCLVIASDVHKEEDYIRNFNDFLNY